MSGPARGGALRRRKANLQVALGTYPHTRQLKEKGAELGLPPVDFAEIAPINRAFAPMVRDLSFDICELALATYLQAIDRGCPLALLPVAIVSRFQEGNLYCRASDARIASPADLAGKRVGVRAYGQTSGVWLRGIIEDDYSVAQEDIEWVTFEDAHVRDYDDPYFARRAEPGKEMLAMLHAGELDAIILGNEKPEDFRLRTVFASPEEAAQAFLKKRRFVPVNHVLVVKKSVFSERTEEVTAFLNAVSPVLQSHAKSADGGPLTGRDAMTPAIDLLARYCVRQGLLSRPLSMGEIWDGPPPAIHKGESRS